MHAIKPVGCALIRVQPRRRLGTWFALLCLMAGATLVLPARAAEKNRIEVRDYRIEATINPEKHHLWRGAQVKFSALDDISIAIFELHNDLRPTKVSDAEGHAMQVERVSAGLHHTHSAANGLRKGQTETLNFEYEGDLISAEDSPVAGLKLAYIGDPSSYLLYAGRWFPGGGIRYQPIYSHHSRDRAAGYTVVGSGGNPSAPGTAAAAPAQTPGASSETGSLRSRARSGEFARKTGAPPAESARPN